jgi:hypothetical protein
MRAFEAMMQLKDLKVGDVMTEKLMSAFDFFLGDLMKSARAIPLQQSVIHFDKNGQAHSIQNELGVILNTVENEP